MVMISNGWLGEELGERSFEVKEWWVQLPSDSERVSS